MCPLPPVNGSDVPFTIQNKGGDGAREHSSPYQYCHTSIAVGRESRVEGDGEKCEAVEYLYTGTINPSD